MRLPLLIVLLAIGGGARAHWTPAGRPSTRAWNALRALPGGFAWAVGDGGSIYATVDAGASWDPQPSPVTSQLLSVDFSSPDYGWASGAGPVALRAMYGGYYWYPVTVVQTDIGIGPPDTIAPISAPDDSHAWALARWQDASFLYHTKDAGVTWSTVAYTDHGYASPNTIYSLDFISDQAGWLAASRINAGPYVPVLMRTADGGATWQSFDAPVTQLNAPSDPNWRVSLKAVSNSQAWMHVWDATQGIGRLLLLTRNAGTGTWGWDVWKWDARMTAIAPSGSSRVILAGDFTWQTEDRFATVHTAANPGPSPFAADFAADGAGFAGAPDGTLYAWTPDIWGDANGDGRVDVTDACVIAAVAAGRPAPSGASPDLLDVDADGRITIADAAAALRRAGGL